MEVEEEVMVMLHIVIIVGGGRRSGELEEVAIVAADTGYLAH
jgi:hypothetical protein